MFIGARASARSRAARASANLFIFSSVNPSTRLVGPSGDSTAPPPAGDRARSQRPSPCSTRAVAKRNRGSSARGGALRTARPTAGDRSRPAARIRRAPRSRRGDSAPARSPSAASRALRQASSARRWRTGGRRVRQLGPRLHEPRIHRDGFLVETSLSQARRVRCLLPAAARPSERSRRRPGSAWASPSCFPRSRRSRVPEPARLRRDT
jgi:hypothetical protein